MPNITRGSDFAGLMRYIAGPGRANEHSEPHLVAGDSSIMAWQDDAELDRAAAEEIARALDEPRRMLGVEVPDGAVWHCSLSLRAEEGQLSDEKWAEIARDFVDGMGFTGAEGRADCRWVAARHGLSKAGNDHIHIVVNLVREDGTKASPWRDRPRAQALAGELERKHGLQVLESRGAGRGDRGVSPAEQARVERTAAVEPERITLARTLRGAAVAAADEAEFVRRVRKDGVLIRPRFAAGTDSVVVGYSVAQRPPAGERPVWFGGGRLARDLSLPRLRDAWPDTPTSASEAAAEWTAAKRGRRPVKPGREEAAVTQADWEAATRDVEQLREWLRSVPVDDTATWARVANETAGAFAAWSARVETTPGPLANAADALARTGQVRAYRVRPKATKGPSAKGAALLLSSIAHGGTGTVAQTVLLRQLSNTVGALHDAHVAVGDAHRAAEIKTAVRERLAVVRAALPAATPAPSTPAAGAAGERASAVAVLDPEAAEAARVARIGQVPMRTLGPVLPTQLEPARRPAEARPGSDRGRDGGR